MPERFKWPCDKRTAHGPHERRWVENEVSVFDRTRQGYLEGERLYVAGQGQFTSEKDCPGVLAHPKTMIGGSHDGV